MKKMLVLTAFVIAALSVTAQKARLCDSRYARFGLEGKTLEDAINSIGILHNEYQEHILSSLVNSGMSRTREGIQGLVKTQTIDFFQRKGIDARTIPSSPAFDANQRNLNIDNIKCSNDAMMILNSLKSAVNEITNTTADELVQRLETLKQSALKLSDETEVIAVGGAISVAINSFQYWKNNFSRWERLLSNGSAARGKPCLGAIGFADVSGAVSGAFGGVVLGPGGALAGGVLVSSTQSLGAAFGCAMGLLFNWW